MRKLDPMLKDYCSKLSIDNLRFLSDRLDNRLGGDLAEALDFMSKNQEIDRWLNSAKSCDDLYNMIDTAQEYIYREASRRVPEMVRG